jgi:Na+-translocating ferredoxin:NAD+ oxidoreductase RnfC subunit
MDEIILKADASSGLKVKAGQKVLKGEQLGTTPESGEPVISPASGIVEKISFDSDLHDFTIVIKSNC